MCKIVSVLTIRYLNKIRGEEMTFHYLMMACHTKIQKKLYSRLKETGLTIGQPKILDYLKDNDGALQKDIAAACHIEPATLTSLLNGMEKAGLAQRRTINGNRRSSYIYLTEKGREKLSLVTKEFEEIEREAFSGLSDSQVSECMETLKKIYENLSE